MISFKVTPDTIFSQNVDSFIFMVPKDALQDDIVLQKTFGQLEGDIKKYIPDIISIAKKQKFTAKIGDVCIVPVRLNDTLVHFVFTGIASVEKNVDVLENIRRGLGHAIKTIITCGHTSTAVQCFSDQWKSFGITGEKLAEEIAEIMHMTAYSFDEYKSKKEEADALYDVVICTNKEHEKAVSLGVKKGSLIGHCVNKARHWVDLPPSDLTPVHLADKAKKIADTYGLAYTSFNEEEANKMGMGGLAGVSRGSERECRLVIMEYKTDKPNAQTIAIVGKGITFDSGGLSLKPPRYMETMKEDMSGAAAVIATMEAVAQLKPSCNVIGVTPLSENLPSGKATKPGDILRFYNGVTAEVKNTDAEGRLVLADALSYTVKHYNPDVIIDLATLTGACAYALGPFYTGLFSEHDDLAEKMLLAGKKTGDLLWRLPLGDDYKKAITSSVADICNIGNDKIQAGATTAAHFLQHFVGDTPWAHLDIAGTAFGVPHKPYYKDGATGVGVRLLVDLLTHWQ